MNVKHSFNPFFLFILLYHGTLQGQITDYGSFKNISMQPDASGVYCINQDSLGAIWLGTNKGLYSYDGYSLKAQYSYRNNTNAQIYCSQFVGANLLYLGTDNGILIYNVKTDSYQALKNHFPANVRALLLMGRKLWIGSLNGLYVYDLDTKEIKSFFPESYAGLPHQTIYSLAPLNHNAILVGTYDGLCQYIFQEDKFHRLDLPNYKSKSNQFVNSLLNDSIRDCIWVGTEGCLFKYRKKTQAIEQIKLFDDNSIKSMALDEAKKLLLGTDNGLYAYNVESNEVQHIIHDSRNNKSLTNNIIWCIFPDREKNLWIGTDQGISLKQYNSLYKYIPIEQITGIGEGNQFYSIYKDHRNNLWLGGTNGLIQIPDQSRPKEYKWFRMGDKKHPLSHNRVRDIYEDSDSFLWVATDGGVNRYDYKKEQFQQYNIIDSSGQFNSNWAYDIFEDQKGNLWVASCLGGVFVVNKEKLLNTTNKAYIADQNYNTNNGLSGNFISQILPDSAGNVWVLIYNEGIDKISIKTNEVKNSSTEQQNKSGELPNYLFHDKNGYIWVGYRNGVERINPKNNKSIFVGLSDVERISIKAIIEENEYLWLSTTKGIWALNKKTLKFNHINIINHFFTSAFYNRTENHIYMGGVDGIVQFKPEILEKNKPLSPAVITAMYVNNNAWDLIRGKDTKSIRYTRKIKLKHNQNNLSFEFSDFNFSEEGKSKFKYMLKGADKSFKSLAQNTNSISYTNLSPGGYKLYIGDISNTKENPDLNPALNIEILPPWYFTLAAKLAYSLLLFILAAWTINYYKVKNRLRLERLEKEKLLELSKLKINFFTDVSHEFKTPLSLILAPISKLITEVKSTTVKAQLELIKRNALKLNSLIHKALDFDRLDNNKNASLLLTKVEFVEFSQSLFKIYKENYKDKNLTFVSNAPLFYINIDQLKIESVLENLISNACKFSKENSEIGLSLNYNKHIGELEVKVSDKGEGIPNKDLPHVTERFYQAKNTQKEGTGIGLYLVKNYIEQHGGQLIIDSIKGSGTTVTFTLPTQSESVESGFSSLSQESATENKHTVLIVDDNLEIADFLALLLSPKYNCKVAHNGKAGLSLCREFLPDLIISDIMMPIMDGLLMCKHIKGDAKTSSIPIILLTAKSDNKTELDSIKVDVELMIPKPFDSKILLSRVEQLLRNKAKVEEQLRLKSLTSLETPVKESSFDEQLLSKVTKIIEDNISEPDFDIDTLSNLAGYHSKQIYRKLKQMVGLSTVEYIKSIRVKKAAMSLAQKKFTVSEVMYMVGFTNHSYFSKCFRAEFGKTPKQYLEEQKE